MLVLKFAIYLWIYSTFVSAQYQRCGNKNKKYQQSIGCFDEAFLQTEGAILAATFISDPVAAAVTGYIPNELGQPLSDSGVHIGYAIDLGRMTLQDLQNAKAPSSLVDKLQAYLGVQQYTATDLINYNNNPLVLVQSEVTIINGIALQNAVTTTRRRYNGLVDSVVNVDKTFRGLSKIQATVLISITLQPGTSDNKGSQVWDLINPLGVNWLAIQGILRSFYNNPNNIYNGRRLREADLLQLDDGSKCCSGILDSGQCISQGPDFMTFDNARKFCLDQGGDLAVIVNMKMMNKIINSGEINIPQGDFPFWVGAIDCTDKNTFVWVDGMKVRKSTLRKFWVGGGPSSSRSLQDCVAYDPITKSLQEYDCTEFRFALCEISMIDTSNKFFQEVQNYEIAKEVEKSKRKKSALNYIYESGKCVAAAEGAECDISFTAAQKEARAIGASVTSVLGEGHVATQDKWQTESEVVERSGAIEALEPEYDTSIGQRIWKRWNKFKKYQKRNVIAEEFRYWLWTTKIVPYTIKTSLFTSTELQHITAAMKSIQDRTCIQYIPRTTEFSYIHFTRGNTERPGCWSFIGRATDNGPSDIHLDTGCTSVGTIQHELMHSLGFWHEHSRYDRDEYVTIATDNIQSGYEMNFAKLSSTYLDTQGEGYDYNSVLHYGMYIFAADPSQPTIIPNVIGADIGQRESVSDNDIAEINKLYECPIPINGGWSQWTFWTECSKTCDSGIMQRSRICNLPVPADGGLDCVGSATEVSLCKTDACPSGDLMYRWYGCWSDPRIPSLLYNLEGEGNLTDDYQTRPNKIETCAIEAQYGGYSVFGLRSGACHVLMKSQEPDLDDYVFLDASVECMNTGYGAVTALDVYILGNVSIVGHYGIWGDYSNCSESCTPLNGTSGHKNRTRQCINPAPEYDWDMPCEGDSMESDDCNTEPCPVDGNWGEWSGWSDCTVTCGRGERYKTRECNNPAPMNGKVCPGFINSTDLYLEYCRSPLCPSRIGCPDVKAPDRPVFAYADSYFSFDEACIGGNSIPGIINVLTSYDGNDAVDLQPGRSNMSVLIEENKKFSGAFFGKDHCIHQPHNCSDGFSVSLWIKPIEPNETAEISPQMIFTSGVESDEENTVNQGQGLAIFLRTDNVLKAVVKTTENTNGTYIGTSYSTDLPQYLITRDKFHHIAVTWGKEDGLKLYYRGAAADWDRNGTKFDGSYLKTFYRYNVGRLCSCDGQQYYGYVDDLAVFNRALTAEEIMEVYMSVPMNCDDCDNNANCTQGYNCTLTSDSCSDSCTCNDQYMGNGWFCEVDYGDTTNPTALGQPLYFWPMNNISDREVAPIYPTMLDSPILSHDTMLVSMGIHDKALVFDGRNDWIDAGHYRNNCLSEPDLCENGVTFSFYLRYHGRGFRHNFIFSTGALPWVKLNSTGISMWIWNVTANVCAQTVEKMFCVQFEVDQGIWAHYSIIWDLVNKLTVYSNGMPLVPQNTTETNQTSQYPMDRILAIGKPSQLMGFNGRFDLDNMVIYDKALMPQEVEGLHLYGVEHSLMKR